jgi:glycosyltransferase involved in cell wall biosynthesis
LSDYLTIGRPIVSTLSRNIPEINSKYNFGLIADDNPEDIAKKVYTVYRDADMQKAMSENALLLSRSLQENWAARASTLEKFYEFLLSR